MEKLPAKHQAAIAKMSDARRERERERELEFKRRTAEREASQKR